MILAKSKERADKSSFPTQQQFCDYRLFLRCSGGNSWGYVVGCLSCGISKAITTLPMSRPVRTLAATGDTNTISVKKERDFVGLYNWTALGWSYGRHGWIKPQIMPPYLPFLCAFVLSSFSHSTGWLAPRFELASSLLVFIPTKYDLIFSKVSTKSHEPASLLLEMD